MSVPVVYDTMVFLQAAARPERTHASFRAVLDDRVKLHLSPELLAEVQDVLNRDTIRAKFPALTPQVVNMFIAEVLAHGTMLDPVPHSFNWQQHPDDNHLFDLVPPHT